MSHGRRRLVLGAAAAAWPVLAAWPARRAAAQSRALRVGLLVSEAAEGAPAHRFVHEFREGMRELGREEGRNYSLQVRAYANERTAMALAAGQLAAARCDVVVAQSSAGAAALKGRTKVPLVVAGAAGPESPAGQVSGLLLFDAGLPARLTALARPAGARPRPADLPFQAPSRFELVLNLKTARELHLVLPSGAILRADRVIE